MARFFAIFCRFFATLFSIFSRQHERIAFAKIYQGLSFDVDFCFAAIAIAMPLPFKGIISVFFI